MVAVIGDGALTGGMAFEALNNAGHLKTDLLVVLNDNEMSINTNVGSLSDYLRRLAQIPSILNLRGTGKFFKQIPVLGWREWWNQLSAERKPEILIVPRNLFEELVLPGRWMGTILPR